MPLPFPHNAYLPDGTPKPLATPRRLATGLIALDDACNGGFPAGALTEVSSTSTPLLSAFSASIANHHAQSGKACAWLASPGTPVDPPLNPIPHPALLFDRPDNVALVALPSLSRESVATARDALVALADGPLELPVLFLSCLSAIPAPSECLSAERHTAHATPAGQALDTLLSSFPDSALVCLEPWHERGPDLPSGPPGPAVRTATCALRLRLESSNLSPRVLEAHILHDRHTAMRGTIQLLAPESRRPCNPTDPSRIPTGSSPTPG